MVNALANHGFLPHDGLNISMGDLIVALNVSVNLAAEGTLLVGSLALLTSQTGNPATFNLDNVDEHNGASVSTCLDDRVASHLFFPSGF